jgi:hypothetical protein
VPQRDLYHDAVRAALISDGWTITHDPYTLAAGAQNVFVDLGAERLLAAERGTNRIAVEIKGFLGPSSAADLELALGQYMIYRSLLARQEPERVLYLAVPVRAAESVFASTMGSVAVKDYGVKLIVCDVGRKVVSEWRP